jgi:hypothetical protein
MIEFTEEYWVEQSREAEYKAALLEHMQDKIQNQVVHSGGRVLHSPIAPATVARMEVIIEKLETDLVELELSMEMLGIELERQEEMKGEE